jgi:hypothetical protein
MKSLFLPVVLGLEYFEGEETDNWDPLRNGKDLKGKYFSDKEYIGKTSSKAFGIRKTIYR